MHPSFTSIFFLSFGALSIIAGILNWKITFWTSISHNGLKDLLGKNYHRFTNIILGIFSIIIGVYFLRN